MTLVFMFPGQSSRYPEMLERVIDAWPPAAAVVERASAVLGRDLRAHYRSGRQDVFHSNRDVQVGVFVASHLHQLALADSGITAALSLGLSLGEYNHLVHIGAIAFEDALRLVDARGEIYDRGPTGMMASVFPLSPENLAPYLKEAVAHGVVEAASLNSPSQTVIAGDRAAVEAAIRLIDVRETGVNAVVIERRVPMHTSVFRPAAKELRPHLEAAPWRTPTLPYIPNVEAAMISAPAPGDIAGLLARHVFRPVKWRHSIELIVALYPETRFVEVGPGQVLYNLLQRRWLRNRRLRTDGEPAVRIAATALEIANAA